MSRQPMRRTIRGGRHYFFADPAIDKVLNMVVVLASEVWTLRERLMAMEAIQVMRGGLKAGEIDRLREVGARLLVPAEQVEHDAGLQLGRGRRR